MVGDSFTYGAGIRNNSKTLAKTLENEVNKNEVTDQTVKVYNLGIMGYSPDQEYRLIIEEVIPKFKPNHIIWNLVIPSDLYDSSIADNWPIPALYGLRDRQLVRHSARTNWFYWRNILFQMSPWIFKNSLISSYLFRFVSHQPFFNRKPDLPADELILWAVRKIAIQAEKVNNLTKKNNFSFTIVLLPNKEHWETKINDLYFDAYRLLLKEFKQSDIPFINIKEVYLKKGSHMEDFSDQSGETNLPVEDLYFEKDFHPNESGVFIFGKLIFEHMDKTGTVSGEKGSGTENK